MPRTPHVERHFTASERVREELEVREKPRASVLTDDSVPVEKSASDLPAGKHPIGDAINSDFLGTAVQTGIASAVIVCTGRDTAFGEIAERLAAPPPETEFGRGLRHFGLMITRVIMCSCSSSCWSTSCFIDRCWSRSSSQSRWPFG
jgi:magnesium-transporting ATPase (P-type)